jgi:hypothetical protein
MPQAFIRITSRPHGGAPAEIRDKWIGLVLPCLGETDEPLADVLTLRRVDRIGGYSIHWADAMRVLGENHPEARKWWETNVPPFSRLIFDKDCCEVVAD